MVSGRELADFEGNLQTLRHCISSLVGAIPPALVQEPRIDLESFLEGVNLATEGYGFHETVQAV